MKFKIIGTVDGYCLVTDSGESRTLTWDQVCSLLAQLDIEKSPTDNIGNSSVVSEGQVLVSVDNENHLVIHSIPFLRKLMAPVESTFLSINEYANLHGRSRAIVSKLCRNGRIEGAIQKGATWLIPKYAPYPRDNRAGRDMSKRDYHKPRKPH